MNTLHLDLSFTTGEPVSPVARIFVKFATLRDGDPKHYVSPDCASPSELDCSVDQLHAELDKIRARGRAKFKTAT
jgi:hypothetical protein